MSATNTPSNSSEGDSANSMLNLLERRESFIDPTGKLRKSALHPDSWISLSLTEIKQITPSVRMLRFAFPSGLHQLGLLPGQYLSVKAEIDGQEVIRFYSPISTPDQPFVDLLIKFDPNGSGAMSSYLSRLVPSESWLSFRGPIGGLVYRPNQFRELGLVCGGTGISPMLQIIRYIIENPNDRTKISMINANTCETEVLFSSQLDEYARNNPEQFHIHYTVDACSTNEWQGGVGFVDQAMLKAHMPPPAPDIKIVMCGPPPMMRAVRKHLEFLGYTPDQLYTFGG